VSTPRQRRLRPRGRNTPSEGVPRPKIPNLLAVAESEGPRPQSTRARRNGCGWTTGQQSLRSLPSSLGEPGCVSLLAPPRKQRGIRASNPNDCPQEDDLMYLGQQRSLPHKQFLYRPRDSRRNECALFLKGQATKVFSAFLGPREPDAAQARPQWLQRFCQFQLAFVIKGRQSSLTVALHCRILQASPPRISPADFAKAAGKLAPARHGGHALGRELEFHSPLLPARRHRRPEPAQAGL
jgi:hypothetical protein